MQLNTVTTADVRDYVPTIPDNSINTIITSPPYWNLREYFNEDLEIGAIGSLEQYICDLVEIFEMCKPKLRDDGLLWVVMGDAYAGSGKGAWRNPGKAKENFRTNPDTKQGKPQVPDGTKPKDLIGMGWMLAFALRHAGWYLRSEIIWHIPNAKPGSYQDRPVTEHQHIFMLAKSRQYYYNYAKARELAADEVSERVLRDVWEINSAGDVKLKDGTRFLHTAKFPVELPQRCIKLACPEDGLVFDPFMGSGSTGVAAVRENVNFIGCDLNPEFVRLANQRIAEEI